MNSIGIIDYGMGNLRSVVNAVAFVGGKPYIIQDASDLRKYDRAILPGVGAFPIAMKNLKDRGFDVAIREYVHEAKMLLGICLGMQLLATSGSEHIETEGLNIIPGKVQRLKDDSVRIPHVGWNSQTILRYHPILEGVKSTADFYFVHSYHFLADDRDDIVSETDYGSQFTAIIAKKNTVGIQFHPEKSQKQGLRILENFVSVDYHVEN